MKIYFEDGILGTIYEIDSQNINFLLDATRGFSFCKAYLDAIKSFEESSTVYTNSLLALNNEYVWNDELGVPEIYLRNKDGEFVRIDKLTHKALRKEHNIMKMYIAGAFRNEV